MVFSAVRREVKVCQRRHSQSSARQSDAHPATEARRLLVDHRLRPGVFWVLSPHVRVPRSPAGGIGPEGHALRPSIPEPPSPRGPWLRRGCVVLPIPATTTSAANLGPTPRLPEFTVIRVALPYGCVLAETETFLLSPPFLSTMPSSPTPGSPTGALVQFFPVGVILRQP